MITYVKIDREKELYIPIVTVDAKWLDDPGENNLVANNSPRSASIRWFRKLIVKPVFLTGSHQSPRCIISDEINVVIIPAYKIGLVTCMWSEKQHSTYQA